MVLYKKNEDEKLTKKLSVKCHPSLIREIRAVAKKSDISASMLVRKWINDGIDHAMKHGGKVVWE
jgi:predicted HicB family RNase H-like nuclease